MQQTLRGMLAAIATLLCLVVLGSAPRSVLAADAPRVGQAAPSFTATDDHGTSRSLSNYSGKFVVLEWHNNGCPYVQKHYNSGNMQQLQKEWTSKGVVWLTVVSSAPGQQGYVTPEQSQAFAKKSGSAATAVLLDPQGRIGHLYGARNTPQMFVIDTKGTLVYDGAIDDRPSADPSSLNGATNYVSQALAEAMAGKPVSTPTSVPYGCTVKYAQ